MRTPLAVILLAHLLLTVLTDKCNLGPAVPSDKIESGSVTIYNSYSNNPINRYHSYTFSVYFTVPFSGLKVSASATSLQASTPNGLDFSIWGNQGSYPNTGTIALLINEDYTWNNIKVHYFVSGRTDNYLGTYSLPIYPQEQTTNTNTIVKYFALPGWTPTTSVFSAFAKIAGITTSAPVFALALTDDVRFDPASGIFTIFIDISTTGGTTSAVTITYLLFSNYIHASTDDYTPQRALYAPYTFVGLEKIQNGQGTVTGRVFNFLDTATGLNCNGLACPSPCISPQICSGNNAHLSPNGGTYCYLCSNAQTYSDNTCRCLPGTILANGKDCLPICGINSYLENGVCKIIPNDCTKKPYLVPIGGNCVCPNGYCFLNNQCIPLQGINYANADQQCTCPFGYLLNIYTGTCSLPGTPAALSSPLSLNNAAVGYTANTIIFQQGVTLQNIPLPLLTAGPTLLNKLLTASVNSQSKAIATVQYLPNYNPNKNRFIVTFTFYSATVIPSFQCTIQINQKYASYFTAIDMQQSLTKSYQKIPLDLGVPPLPPAVLDQAAIESIFSKKRG